MKSAGWIVALLLFLGSVALLGLGFVYHQRTVGDLKQAMGAQASELNSTQQTLKSAQADNIRFKVYAKEYDKMALKARALMDENQQLKIRLGEFHDAASQVITREILRKKVVGMEPAEVVAFIGDPSRQLGPSKEFWYYENGITRDPQTGVPDKLVQIQFDGGKARRVVFK